MKVSVALQQVNTDVNYEEMDLHNASNQNQQEERTVHIHKPTGVPVQGTFERTKNLEKSILTVVEINKLQGPGPSLEG